MSIVVLSKRRKRSINYISSHLEIALIVPNAGPPGVRKPFVRFTRNIYCNITIVCKLYVTINVSGSTLNQSVILSQFSF